MNDTEDKSGANSLIPRADEFPVSFPSDYLYPSEETLHLKDYLRVILRRKWIVITFFLIVVTTVIIGTYMAIPIYRSSATIRIDRETPHVLAFKDVYDVERADDNYYQTQYKILRSRSLAKRVVRAMKLDQNPAFTGGPAPAQKAAGSMSKPSFANQEDNVNPGLVDMIMGGLNVEPLDRSSIVRVSYDSPSPDLAAQIPNEVAKAYIALNVESKFGATLQARDWLDNQLQDMKAKVERSEEALNLYAAQHGLLFLTEGASDKKGQEGESISMKRLSELSSQFVQATSERVTKEVMFRESQKAGGEAIAAVQNSPLIQNLKKQYAEIESQYAQMSTIYKPGYPKMVQLKEQLNKLNAQMDAETRKALEGLRVEYEAAGKKENYLKSALEKYRAEVTGQNEKMVQFSILKREAETNRELYNGLLQRLKEIGITASLTASNIQVLDKAEIPGGPFKPDKRKNIMMAIMVGLIGGIGLAFFVEYLDNTVKTTDDVEKRMALPSLGFIPSFEKDSGKSAVPVITFEDKKSPLSEAFRSIGTYIQFSSADRPPKTILVTSARQGEGKTTTVVNLAVSLAHTCGKGIIIDSDLRRPQLHKILNLDNSRGLSSFLSGHTDFDANLIKKCGVNNLDAIPSGIIPPNPSELLSSGRMKDLVQRLFPLYSFIILDAPPILGLSDSLVLSTMTDGVIMVARARTTPRDAAIQTKKLLQGVNAKILGVILNGITAQDLKYGGSYSYYYSYYYEDGYASNENKKGRGKRGSI